MISIKSYANILFAAHYWLHNIPDEIVRTVKSLGGTFVDK